MIATHTRIKEKSKKVKGLKKMNNNNIIKDKKQKKEEKLEKVVVNDYVTQQWP